MWCKTIDTLRQGGFTGFKTIDELRGTKLSSVPDERGVYLILRDLPDAPSFIAMSTGGHFKAKDPTAPVALLAAKWVSSAVVMYVGKAGAEGGEPTLRSRLKAYFDFGAGKAVGHWGGRYIWQLSGSDALLVCWKSTPNQDPREVEKGLIASFRDCFGQLPFANCKK
jgi:hypothetical protein